MRIKLESGREVLVARWYVSNPYESWMEGRPTAEDNQEFLASCRDKARQVLSRHPLVMLEPEMESRWGGEWLPGWCVTVELTSDGLGFGHGFSALTLMWFESDERMATLPFPALVSEAVRKVNWGRSARDYEEV